MKPIYPCIWTNQSAKEAAEFYVSIFPEASIQESNPLVTSWRAGNSKFMLLNGGPEFTPSPTLSFYSEFPEVGSVEKLWEKLVEDGKALMPLGTYPWSEKYGWVQDRYGVSWQLTAHPEAPPYGNYSPAMMFTGRNFGKAEEALNFYTSIVPDSLTKFISRYGEDSPSQTGKINHAQFTLGKQLFVAMDSGLDHGFQFSEGISLVIPCENQDEIDYYWEKLTLRGEEGQCGWLKDQFGVSWQIVPDSLGKLIASPIKGPTVIQAFLKMKKINIEKLTSN